MPLGRTSSAGSRSQHFQKLVHPHLVALFVFLCRRLNSDADAKDVLQNALLRAWSNLDSLRDPANVRAWLYRVVRNEATDHARTFARRQGLVSITSLEEARSAVLSDEVTPLDQLMTLASSECVRSALASLPTEFAAAVELHDLDGLLYREIAIVLDVPMGTVMSRISRGREMLAGILVKDRAKELRGRAPTDRPGSSEAAAARATRSPR